MGDFLLPAVQGIQIDAELSITTTEVTRFRAIFDILLASCHVASAEALLHRDGSTENCASSFSACSANSPTRLATLSTNRNFSPLAYFSQMRRTLATPLGPIQANLLILHKGKDQGPVVTAFTLQFLPSTNWGLVGVQVEFMSQCAQQKMYRIPVQLMLTYDPMMDFCGITKDHSVKKNPD